MTLSVIHEIKELIDIPTVVYNHFLRHNLTVVIRNYPCYLETLNGEEYYKGVWEGKVITDNYNLTLFNCFGEHEDALPFSIKQFSIEKPSINETLFCGQFRIKDFPKLYEKYLQYKQLKGEKEENDRLHKEWNNLVISQSVEQLKHNSKFVENDKQIQLIEKMLHYKQQQLDRLKQEQNTMLFQTIRNNKNSNPLEQSHYDELTFDRLKTIFEDNHKV